MVAAEPGWLRGISCELVGKPVPQGREAGISPTPCPAAVMTSLAA